IHHSQNIAVAAAATSSAKKSPPCRAAASATPIMITPETIRTESSFKLSPSPTEAALAAREMLDCPGEGLLVEVGPEQIEEQEFRISRLPQKEIGQPVGVELGGDARFVDRRRRDLARRGPLAQGAGRSGDFGARAVIERDDQGQARIVP